AKFQVTTYAYTDLRWPMLSKSHGAMHRDDAGGKVVDLHRAETRGLEHGLQRGLVRMHADRFGEVAIRFARAHHALAEPRQHAERVEIVERLERGPDARELEHHEAAAFLQDARHLGKRPLLVRHVAQAEADGDAVEIAGREGQAFGVALHRGRQHAAIEQAIAPALQHLAVDVRRPDLALRRHAPRERRGEIAAARSDVKHALAGTRARAGDGECLPVAMQAERHEVVHHVVAFGDPIEHLGDAVGFLRFADLAKTEVDFPGHGLLARGTRLLYFGEVLRPKFLLVLAKLVQVVPGIDAGAVAVGKDWLHGVRADRIERTDLDIALAGLQHFLSGPVAFHLSRRRVDAQVLVRQPEALAIGKRDLQHARFLVQR